MAFLTSHCWAYSLQSWWRHQMETFSALLALCAGNSPSPGEFPHKRQWRGALVFSLICVWLDGWVNNGEAGDLRPYSAHYDVTVMCCDVPEEHPMTYAHGSYYVAVSTIRKIFTGSTNKFLWSFMVISDVHGPFIPNKLQPGEQLSVKREPKTRKFLLKYLFEKIS